MDDFNRNDDVNRNTENNESQTTPFQTPVRGADENPGSGYAGAGGSQTSSQDGQTYSGASYTSSGAGGSTPPPGDNGPSAYEEWSGSKRPKKKEKKPRKPGSGRWKAVVAVVLVAAIAFGVGMFAGGTVDFSTMGSTSSSTDDSGSALPENSTQLELKESSGTSDDSADSYSDIYEAVSPSIVAIVVDEIQMGTESSGSGVIMSEDGYIITNNHVVEDGDLITVVLSDSTTYSAEVIGTDEQTDLAVLKIDATGLTAAEFGDSDDVKVGDRCFAIGSPGGIEFQNSFTGGFVSAINRNVTINDYTMTLIQTDTAINPGNSGGALINTDGQVIGITSSKLSSSSTSSTSYEGMGFAIPSSTVKEIVDELIAYGYVTGRPAIGISGYDIDETRAAYYNLPQGVMVSSVDTASDAYTQGVQAGDIITGVNGTEITCMDDINDMKEDLEVGDTMELTIYRSGETLTITVTLIDESDLSGTSSTESDSSSSDDSSGYGSYGNGTYGYSVP